jgi:predicted permease
VPRRNAFYRDVLSRVEALPGVTAAGINTGMHPFGGWGVRVDVPAGRQDERRVGFSQINPGYLKVYGFRLLAGRGLTEQDAATAQRVALVNEAFVKRYLPDRTAVGATVGVPMLSRAPANLADPRFEIVGVLRDMVNSDPKEGVQPEMFVPYSVLARAGTLVVLAAMDPASLTRAVASQVYSVDPDQPVTEVRTIEETMKIWVLSRPRFNLILFSVFAVLGLVLTVVGVYGVVSNAVAQRTPEIGLRMALGAAVTDVGWMVLRQGMALVAIGLAVGLAATIAAGRLLKTRMSDLAEFDPVAFAAVAAVMILAGAAACLWPAQRAARVDPVVALRAE